MVEYITLGIIQGIVEWLPVSSEGFIVLVRTAFFDQNEVLESISIALYLHLGTFVAALIYFKKEVLDILRSSLNYRGITKDEKAVLHFYAVATIVSTLLGGILLLFVSQLETRLFSFTGAIMVVVGILLLITGALELKASTAKDGDQKPSTLTGILLGVVQGFAALPGLSRSGLTVSTLLLARFSKEDALRLSFIISLPIVLGGNVLLNLSGFGFSLENLTGLLFSFIFGLLTIDALMRLARRFNFGWFVIFFGALSIIAGIV